MAPLPRAANCCAKNRCRLQAERTCKGSCRWPRAALSSQQYKSSSRRKGSDKYPPLSLRRNIVVIADEAHRSQYDFIDGFARHMRDALPSASFIGFTGTPLELADKNTELSLAITSNPSTISSRQFWMELRFRFTTKAAWPNWGLMKMCFPPGLRV